MVFDEGGDEIILAVIVARLAPKNEGIADLRCGLLQQVGMQLRIQKLIASRINTKRLLD
jgi:hypothetical protein